MSQKKRVRIYKAGGQQGAYINPTAQWMMKMGGQPQAQSEISDEQISAYVQNALMQDADPNDIYKSLLQSGVDKNKANQIISSIVEYINEARKVEMADKTGQPELAQKEAEEMAALERAAAEEDAQRARQMQMMQTAMEDTQADEDMFTNDLIDDYIEGNDEQMMYGGQPLPSKSKFVNRAMKEYKKGGAIGQGQKPDEASLNAATNFIQSINKESNEAKIKQEAEQYYDNVMLPQARRGKEMRTQRMLNRGLNQILGGASNMGMTNPYMYSEANPYGAQLKTANIDVRKTGLFGRPKQYSVQFDWDYINQPQLVEDAIDLEVNNTKDEVKDTQKQQVAKKNETTSENSRLKELAKKRASGEVKSSGTGGKGKSKKKVSTDNVEKSTPEETKETYDVVDNYGPKSQEASSKLTYRDKVPEFISLADANVGPIIGYPGAGIGSAIADLYSWITGDEEVDRQTWDQTAASLILGIPSSSPKALGQGFTSGKAVYTPPPGAARLPAGTPGFPNVPGTAVPRIGTSGLPKGLPAGPRGYLNPGQKMISAPDGTQLVLPFKQGGMHNQFGGAVNPFTLDSTGLAKFIYGGSDPMMAMGGDPRKREPSKIFQAISKEVADINPNWENEYYHFNRGKGKVYKTAGDRFKTFKQDIFPNKNQDVRDYNKVTTVFQDGGSNDLTMYKTGKEKQDEFWTNHYRKPDTGEIINQETGAVVTLPNFTDDVTTQTGTSDYEKRIKELENQLAGFKSNAGVPRDMYGRQLPPPLFNRRARDLAGMGSLLGMAGVLNPLEYAGSWNQYSDMYDPNTGERIPDEVRKRIGLPNLTEIDVRKSRLIGGRPKDYSLKFGMPGSASTSKEDLRENIAMDNNNSFSNIDSKGRLLREKEDTPYNRISDKKWEKFKEKESKKNIPEDYVSPETKINLSDLSSIQTNQKPIGVENNILGKENSIMPEVPVAQQEISNLINPSASEDFNSWLSRNAMGPSIPPADMANNPNIGLDLLAAEDYASRSLNEGFNGDYLNKFIKNSYSINDTLPPGYSIRESDGTLMIPDPFDYNSPGPRNPQVTKTVSTNDPVSRRMNAGLSIFKLKDETFPGNPNLRNEIQSMVRSYSQENNIPEENFKQYQRLLPEQKLELINKAKNSGKQDLYEILIYLADAGSNSSSDDALGQAKKGGMPKFQTDGQFDLADTSAIEVDEDSLMGERPDYVQFYDNKEYMFSGKDDSFIGPAQVDVKENDSYIFDPTKALDLGNVAAYKFLNNMEKPDFTKFTGTNIYDSNMDVSDKGTYDIDSGLFRPGRMGFEGVVQKGGAINDEIYMTEEEIEEFLRNGGQLEYL